MSPSSLSFVHTSKPWLSLLWLGADIQYGLKILILNCRVVWRSQMTAVTIAMMSRDPLSLPWQSWPVHLGPSKCFQTFWGYCKFWLLAWNTEMPRQNCKINFRYSLFGKNTTSLPVMVLGCGFREASAAFRWILVLPSDPCPLNIQLLFSACSRQSGWMRLGQSWWRQGNFFPWTVTTLCRFKLFHWLLLYLFTVYYKKLHLCLCHW